MHSPSVLTPEPHQQTQQIQLSAPSRVCWHPQPCLSIPRLATRTPKSMQDKPSLRPSTVCFQEEEEEEHRPQDWHRWAECVIACYLQPQPQQHQQGANDTVAVAAAAAAGPISKGQAAQIAQQPAQPLVLHLSVTTCAVLQRLQLQGTAVRPVPDQGHWVLDFGELLLSMHSHAAAWLPSAHISYVLFRPGLQGACCRFGGCRVACGRVSGDPSASSSCKGPQVVCDCLQAAWLLGREWCRISRFTTRVATLQTWPWISWTPAQSFQWSMQLAPSRLAAV